MSVYIYIYIYIICVWWIPPPFGSPLRTLVGFFGCLWAFLVPLWGQLQKYKNTKIYYKTCKYKIQLASKNETCNNPLGLSCAPLSPPGPL